MSENRLYKFLGFWWSCNDSFLSFARHNNISGPFCLDCYCELDIPDDEWGHSYDVVLQTWTGILVCENCGKKHKLSIPITDLKEKVSLKLKAGYLSQLNKISLEEPLPSVKVRDQDDKYFLAAKIGQKDGKRVGVVYFGEKNKDQKKDDYSQIFIDIDDDQIRFDKSNKVPKEILVKMKVEFRETEVEEKYKK